MSKRAVAENVHRAVNYWPCYGGGKETLWSRLASIGGRGWFAHDPSASGGVRASHPSLESVADFMREDTVGDYVNHEGVYLQLGKRTGALMGAFVWNTSRGQACGGIRLREYASAEDYLRDGLRLAIGMGRKSALAGLWAGGGKGVIAVDPSRPELCRDPFKRKQMFQDYGDFLSSLRGCYVAAEDAGLNVVDCDTVFSRTRFMTCIDVTKGGSGNPSVPTAAGVATAIEAALDFRSKSTVDGKTIAIQGAGNVARPLMQFLFNLGAKRIVASDIDPDTLERARREVVPTSKSQSFELRLASPGDLSILSEPCDVLSPCAYGACLTDNTIAALNCEIVVGAANNQLADPSNGDVRIGERGITYVPDFVANRMGIVNCADEFSGRVGRMGDHMADPIVSRHLVRGSDWENSVFNITQRVLAEAEAKGLTPGQAANEMADAMAEERHPIFPGRSRDIQASLRAEWIEGNESG